MKVVIAVLFGIGLLPQPHTTKRQVPIEKLVAGYSVLKSGSVVARDTKSGCYLVRSGE